MKVNILLAAYNGERFIREQVASIQAQTYQEWNLLIRDDGSQDGTREIISELAQADSRIHWIDAKSSVNLGVIKSFHRLMTVEKADYYFFSDQDDIWLPNKLELSLQYAQSYPKGKPLLVYTDLKVVDQNLQVLRDSMIRTQSDHANTSLIQELTENTVTGGTMLINHDLAQLWTLTDDLVMHDWYLALLAAALGHLVYLDEPTELYRQHDANVLGARTLTKRMKNWLRPHRLVAKYWWLIQISQKQATHLLNVSLSDADRDMVQAYVTLLDQPFSERLRRLKVYGFRKNRPFHTFIFRSLVLTKFGYRSPQ